MLDSDSDHENSEPSQESPTASPNLSSPVKPDDIASDNSSEVQSDTSNSKEFENQSDNSSSSCSSRVSPPSSPVRPGRKRPSYGGYRENPLIPVPRQTLNRWKKTRADDQADNNSDHSLDDNAVTADGREILANASQASDVTFRLQDFSEDSIDQTCNLSQSSCSDSSQDELSISAESDDNTSLTEFNLSGSSFSSNSDVLGLNSGSDTDSDNNSDQNDPFEADWLYPGCEKTKDEAIYEIMNIYLCKKLSVSALKDILKFYVSSLPATNVMPSSIHLLFKYVKNLSFHLNEKNHYYCRPGMHPVASKSDSCALCQSVDIGVFYELPLDNILKFLLEQRDLAALIDKYSKTRSQNTAGTICDIVDGSEYQRVWSGISDQYKLTLILNTDGVSPHKSSKAKFWPLMFTIMEIPPELRSSFTVVWGIWFDKKYKPDMNLFLKPFVSSIEKINEDGGVSWRNSSTHETYRSPVRAPVIVADAPARAAVVNMQEHQAKYACNTCEQKTSKLPAPLVAPGEKKKRRKRRFTFREEAANLRTNQRIIVCGNVAETNSEPKRGIKGPTVIRYLPSIDLSTCVFAEYMHGALGVVKLICSLWLFEPGEWYIGNHADEINRFVESEIHPPDFISRLPRSLEYFCFLKANEFRSFLLYYSLIIVAPYLNDKYHQHWMLFVRAIFLLLTESISENDILEAETLLRLFVRDLGSLYGNEQCVYNVHQLLHLGLYVRRWGCLWSNSAFSFEDMNGTLSDMIHGSKNEGRELLNQLSLAQGNQILKNKIVNETIRRSGFVVRGKPIPYILSDLEKNIIRQLNFGVEDVNCFGRISVGRETFSSSEYDKNFKRRNSYVEVKHGNRKIYGRISVFCKCDDNILCIVSVLKVVQSKFFFHRASLTRIGHIIPVENSGDIIVCKVKDIVRKFIKVGDYLCCRPNSIERNL